MKKFIFLSFVLFLNTSLYAVTYCPQTLACDGQSCIGLPKDFFISAGRPKANTTYYFNHASDGSKVGISVACSYGDITISRNALRANVDYPGSKWKATFLEDYYICSHNSLDCPFK